MKIEKTDLPGLLIIKPDVYEDNRGYFFESYNRKSFLKENLTNEFLQDNQARSTYGIVRGLHYQLDPYAQTKLIRVLSGKILDVVVDLRKQSPTFGIVFSLEISDANKLQLLVPRGFAHGYSVLSQTAEMFYKCDAYYNKESERGIIWNDSELKIDWKIPPEKVIISEKDSKHPGFSSCDNNFVFQESL